MLGVRVRAVDEIPRGNHGKVDRAATTFRVAREYDDPEADSA